MARGGATRSDPDRVPRQHDDLSQLVVQPVIYARSMQLAHFSACRFPARSGTLGCHGVTS